MLVQSLVRDVCIFERPLICRKFGGKESKANAVSGESTELGTKRTGQLF